MASIRRVWLKHGGRRTKVPIGAPFFEEGTAPPDPTYRALRPEEEADSLMRWKAAQLRQVNRLAPTAGELSTVAMLAGTMLALMGVERFSLFDGSAREEDRIAGVQGGGVERFAGPLAAELPADDEGLRWTPPGNHVADSGVGATILGPFRYHPDAAQAAAPVIEDRLDGMTLRPGTAGYLAGTAAPDAAPGTPTVTRPLTDAEAQLATALPSQPGVDGAPTDAPSTIEHARQMEAAERPGAMASSGAVAAPQAATPESVWAQMTWQWQRPAAVSPAQPDPSPSAPAEGSGSGLPDPGVVRSPDDPAPPPLLASGPDAPQEPGSSGKAQGHVDGVPPGVGKQEDGPGGEGPPVLADLLPPGLGMRQEGGEDGFLVALPPGLAKREEADDGGEDGLLAALPPGLAKREEADDGGDDGLLAALPPGLAKREEADEGGENGSLAALPPGLAKREEADEGGENGLLAALPPGLAKREEADEGGDDGVLAALPPGLAKRGEADEGGANGLLAALPPGLAKREEGEDGGDGGLLAMLPPGLAKRAEGDGGRGSAHDDVVVLASHGHGRGGPDEVGPHGAADPIPEVTLFAALPALPDAIL